MWKSRTVVTLFMQYAVSHADQAWYCVGGAHTAEPSPRKWESLGQLRSQGSSDTLRVLEKPKPSILLSVIITSLPFYVKEIPI